MFRFWPCLMWILAGALAGCVSGVAGENENAYYSAGLAGGDEEHWPTVAVSSEFRISIDVPECMGDDNLEIHSSNPDVVEILSYHSWGNYNEQSFMPYICDSGAAADAVAHRDGTTDIEVRYVGGQLLDTLPMVVTTANEMRIGYGSYELEEPIAVVAGCTVNLAVRLYSEDGQELGHSAPSASWLGSDSTIAVETNLGHVVVNSLDAGARSDLVVTFDEVEDRLPVHPIASPETVDVMVKRYKSTRFTGYVAAWSDDDELVLAPPFDVEVSSGAVEELETFPDGFYVVTEDEVSPVKLRVISVESEMTFGLRDRAKEEASWEELADRGPRACSLNDHDASRPAISAMLAGLVGVLLCRRRSA